MMFVFELFVITDETTFIYQTFADQTEEIEDDC